MLTIRTIISHVLFVAAYVVRHHRIPADELTQFVVSQTKYEPMGNMPGNAWRWAA